MKSFEEYIKEGLEDNPVKQKQIDNNKYKVTDDSNIQRFNISIHPNLTSVLSDILKGNKYIFTKDGNSDNSFIVDGKYGDTGNKLNTLLYSELSNMFAHGDQRLVQYAGSSNIEDFIDSDVHLNIDLIK
jgi:hypothetical protein